MQNNDKRAQPFYNVYNCGWVSLKRTHIHSGFQWLLFYLFLMFFVRSHHLFICLFVYAERDHKFSIVITIALLCMFIVCLNMIHCYGWCFYNNVKLRTANCEQWHSPNIFERNKSTEKSMEKRAELLLLAFLYAFVHIILYSMSDPKRSSFQYFSLH